MNNLEALDAASGGPFTYLHDEERLTGPDPTALPFQIVLAALEDQAMPGTPTDIPYWKVTALFEQWQAHYDLPEFEQARRLAYVIDHYIDTLTYDLQAHLNVDLGALWRDRRWNTLLAYIDRLPRWSLYYEAVANDPEHAEMVAEALEADTERDDSGVSAGPALSTWTPEVERLVELIDAVRGLHYLIPAAAGSKDVKPPKPLPRPTTALEKARKAGEHRRRMAKHKSLAARMLPHKYQASDESPR